MDINYDERLGPQWSTSTINYGHVCTCRLVWFIFEFIKTEAYRITCYLLWLEFPLCLYVDTRKRINFLITQINLSAFQLVLPCTRLKKKKNKMLTYVFDHVRVDKKKLIFLFLNMKTASGICNVKHIIDIIKDAFYIITKSLNDWNGINKFK